MTGASPFWSAWAPYWSHIEDNYLDLDSVDRLAPVIEEPVLVVGADLPMADGSYGTSIIATGVLDIMDAELHAFDTCNVVQIGPLTPPAPR